MTAVTEACPKCQVTTHRKLSAGGRVRVECNGCGRLVRWEQPIPQPKLQPDRQQVPPLSPPPPDWLYTSRRLDLAYLPNAPFYAATVIVLGSTPHYRVTPDVYVWLTLATQRYNTASPTEAETIVANMHVIGEFVALVHGRDAIEAAKATKLAQLPEVPRCPDW